jgi:hypothetical protein
MSRTVKTARPGKPKTPEQVCTAMAKLLDTLDDINKACVMSHLSAYTIYALAEDKGHGLSAMRDAFFEDVLDHIERLPHDPSYHHGGADFMDELPMDSAAIH